MYEEFFNLRSKPFSLLPDPDFLYLSGRHSVGLSLLEYSLTGQAGYCVITGEVGSGKTTLIRAFMNKIGREFTVGLISNTHNAISDVGAWALYAFGQKPQSNNPAEVYQELMAFLIAEYGAGRQCVLVVDEAQNLSIAALEELRLLSNINSGKDLLLQIILVGQPELLENLKRPDLRQFAQRIAVSHHLIPFTFAETRSYIQHRLEVAGTTEPIFASMAIGAIQYFSGGIPRLINSICDLSMVYAFADGTRVVTDELVFRVISDRQVGGLAPFAHSEGPDRVALREKIQSISPEVSSPPIDAPPPAAAPTPGSDLLPKTPAPAVSTSGDPTPIAEPEPKRSATERSTKAAATGNVAVLLEHAVSGPTAPPAKEQDARRDYLFHHAETNDYDAQTADDDTETTDLLLTEEVAGPADTGLNGHAGVQPSEASNHRTATVGAQLGAAGAPIASIGLSSSLLQTTQSDLVAVRTADRGLRYSGDHGDSVFAAQNSGTIRSARRSWWRRAFLGGDSDG